MSPRSSKRRGTPPDRDAKTVPNPDRQPTIESDGHPILCLRHLQPRFDIEALTPKQCREFLVKWHKRAQLTWKVLVQHDKHGLGWEMITRKAIFPSVPDELEYPKYMVFRHEGNQSFAGFRAGDVFHVLWIEPKYNKLYDHGS